MTVKTEKNDAMALISKNTYYMLPRWFISLALTKKYKKISKKDIKDNNYFIIGMYGIQFKISFKSIFGTNSKIKGIKSLDFDNATFCSSFRLGYCRIPCQQYCYAWVFEHQYKEGHDGFYFTFNAYFKGFLMSYITRLLNDIDLKLRFLNYIDSNIDVLRFNVNSDFKSLNDWNLLLDIAHNCKNTVIYGYTARDDLLTDYNSFKTELTNLTVNGSNMVYDNQYKAVFSLSEYCMASFKCIGSCMECKKCFKLSDVVITTLFHNSRSDSILNTIDNRNFIIGLFKGFNIELSHNDLTILKGLYSSLNKHLKGLFNGLSLKDYDINNLKDICDFKNDLNDILNDMAYMPKIDYKALNLF